jgi:hypothetical protein
MISEIITIFYYLPYFIQKFLFCKKKILKPFSTSFSLAMEAVLK